MNVIRLRNGQWCDLPMKRHLVIERVTGHQPRRFGILRPMNVGGKKELWIRLRTSVIVCCVREDFFQPVDYRIFT